MKASLLKILRLFTKLTNSSYYSDDVANLNVYVLPMVSTKLISQNFLSHC